jgi:DNA-binding MarR family transcriptional regulator
VTDPQPPPGVAPSAAFLLSGLGRLVREAVEAELRAAGLSLRHLSALGHLAREPGLSYSELARRAGVTAQSMQATLRALEEAGAVERVTPAGRGRTAELRLTGHGRALLATGRARVDAVDDRLLGDLDPAEHAELTRLLLRAFTLVTTTRPN